MPQAVSSLPATHSPSAQQPVAQVGQPRQRPVRVLHFCWVAAQLRQLAPSIPQVWSLSPATHSPLSQQPVVHSLQSVHSRATGLQVSPRSEQSTQGWPPRPQALLAVPSWQPVSRQQPSGQ
jgi:hypothetical protein